ncbi:hypothetical protein [Haloarchaeobius iranensis]|uniref:Uncharacterized protein n=1 Tax=Haloarchaeobius iranensis TaxID=996166 RepID=A0A1G9VCS7_9EURY|nr:hypothetical protein [Haloarchaeobius iranensis]SDM69675.1 hypothetical protein SAMN05192554_10625 [Haloarchaeobius iranensis]
MVRFRLDGVYGGWEAAVTGPSDHVEFAVATDDDTVYQGYGSVHSLLRLYDLARLERAVHPQFLGYDVAERGGTVLVDLQMGHLETTYDELQAAMEPFLAELFETMDGQTVGERADHIATIQERELTLVDVDALYDRLV